MSETQPRTALAGLRDAIRHRIYVGKTLGDPEGSIDQVTDLTTVVADRPRPLEFDHNGFPVAQRRPDFDTRVARLRGP